MTRRAVGIYGNSLAVCLTAFGVASTGPTLVAQDQARATFERDRASILAMAGEFKVRFDMRETVSFVADYEPLAPKVSGGHEVVRVVEDTGRVIRLQHLLVVELRDKTALVGA
jgi:hypothetical protein